MSQLKGLLEKYGPLGLDSTVIQYMFNSGSEAEKKRMCTDENYFFDKYQEFS